MLAWLSLTLVLSWSTDVQGMKLNTIRDDVASVLLKDVILVWKSKMPCSLLKTYVYK
jgi:hypothetical protein